MKFQLSHFRIVLIATISWIIVMRLYSPANIVQFEFAGTTENAAKIISDWGTDGQALARTSTYLDFIFLILYCAAISLGCRAASNFSQSLLLIKTGIVLSWIIWLAGLCDAIENVAMLKTLQEITAASVSVAWYFAAIKFSIVGVALLFIITAYLTGLVKKLVK